ncbi:MAG: outer membrane protein assembly factor BamA [Bacteroidota bacterium]
MKKLLVFCLMLGMSFGITQAQLDRENPKTYILKGLEVEGSEYSDKNAIISISGLVVGEQITVPGLQVSEVLKRLWKENLFADVKVRVDKIEGPNIFLTIEVKERPRISQFSFEGISKGHAEDLREKINFIRGTILTESKEKSAKRIIRNFYVEKGHYNVAVDIISQADKILKNGVTVNIKVDKGPKIRIKELNFENNTAFEDPKLRKKLKKIHQKTWWRFWARSKYFPKQFEESKAGLIEFYNEGGFRDAIVLSDTVYRVDDKHVNVTLNMYEGIRYYHRNISWSGNFKYNSDILGQFLRIKKGDIYSKAAIDRRLFGDPQGGDVSSLYLDDGYLFFNLDPVEVAIVGDSIDLEMRISEGPQATIRKVPIHGNSKTSDFVIRREIRTTPGDKFRRRDIIRSQREILALNYFDQETLGVDPIPNQATGTVDIKYTVEERPSDQLQLQGGWGGQLRDPQTNQIIAGGFVGTVQLAFNNFAAKRILQPGAWRPVPSGDGQKLSLSFQMNGVGYKNFSISFLEPWLGGKKPTSLGVSTSYLLFQNVRTNYRNNIFNISVDLGKQLQFPDDFFTARYSIAYKYYDILQPGNVFRAFVGEDVAYVNSLSFRYSLDRSSVDAPIYPRSGSIMNLSVEATPPWSIFKDDQDFTDLSPQEKFNLLEFHKWQFNSNWFFNIVGDMVLNAKIEAGYLGAYNENLGISPFERFFLGGSGMVGNGLWGLDGRDIVPLRGYDDATINNGNNGYPIYNRFIMELRYPISLNQSAPIWMQAFLEAGNGYGNFREYNPFKLRRAAGAGLRVMLPMVGLLGLDWAYGFDLDGNNQEISAGQFHFVIGQQF